jgi:hypothetical protein
METKEVPKEEHKFGGLNTKKIVQLQFKIIFS